MKRTLHRDFSFSEEIFRREVERILPGVVLRRAGGGLAQTGGSPCARRPGRERQLIGAIRCPYHSWTYSLDGSLRAAPFLDEEPDFSRADLPLYRVGVESWGGFVFLNLTPAEAPGGRAVAFILAGPGLLPRWSRSVWPSFPRPTSPTRFSRSPRWPD
jgi:nitrite reductase/ring-hydroxylating ferredoxin subunit